MTYEKIAEECYAEAMRRFGVRLTRENRLRNQTDTVRDTWLAVVRLAIALSNEQGD